MAENAFSAMTARPTRVAEGVAAVGAPRWPKYTISLPPHIRRSIDEDVDRLAEHTGLRVDRRHVTIALYEALHDDESLFAEVKQRMPRLVEELANRRDG